MYKMGRKYWVAFYRSMLLRRFAIWLVQVAVFYVSIRTAALLRFDFKVPPSILKSILLAIPIWIVIKMLTFAALRLLRGWWAYLSVVDVAWLAVGSAIAPLLCLAGLAGLHYAPVPRSIYIIDAMISFLLTSGVRVGVRLLAEWKLTSGPAIAKTDILIYGAGEAGLVLMREIRRNPALPYRVRGFVDDQPSKKGLRISGIPVLGGGAQIGDYATRYGIEMVLIAIPSASGAQMTAILENCRDAGVACKTVPGLAEIISGNALAGQIRDVAVEDLLGRSPVELAEEQIREGIEGKIILVTGAGGSIGSELCRQIARFSPAGIVGFEAGETALFEIDREMRELFPGVPFYPEIGNVQNSSRLDEVFSWHRPHAVFHAAAYKHVPLMETHIFEAVENNIFGTYNTATAAIRAGVESFVLISTDKAVCPTNVMGATKRVCEQLLLSLESQVKFAAVRFGNVLGSNGSVIPIFKKQIANGGPVTVTHPEMRRFFMTIPEACQLVLQAATIAEGGQICVLDMGEPVKIVDLARNLILLSGLTPGRDIEIEFTGTRPGEKLNEELTSDLECTWPSSHEKIRIYGHLHRGQDPSRWLKSLREICRTRDSGRLVLALREMVDDYNPSSQLLKRALQSQRMSIPEIPHPRSAAAVPPLAGSEVFSDARTGA